MLELQMIALYNRRKINDIKSNDLFVKNPLIRGVPYEKNQPTPADWLVPYVSGLQTRHAKRKS